MSFVRAVALVLLPPTGFALLALLALPFLRLRPARAFVSLMLLALVVASLPIVADLGLVSLAPPTPTPTLTPTLTPDGAEPWAIVVLSADAARTGEPGDLAVGPLTLEREAAAARLRRQTGLPILVTGGVVTVPQALGVLMSRSLPEDFGVPVQWVESNSTTTWENAQFSAPILRQAGITRVYLVTHAWHMRRALLSFREAGLDPVPYVVRHDAWPRLTGWNFVPSASAWLHSYWTIHEWVGLLAYALR